MKERKRETCRPRHLVPGDIVHVRFHEQTLVEEIIDRAMIVDTAIIFDIEPGDFQGIKGGIGGVLAVSDK